MTLQPGKARRTGARALVLLAAFTVAGMATLAGCDPRMAMYFLQPFEPKIPAPCTALKGKKVVLLTTASAGLRTDFLNIDREIARRVAEILREKIKKLDLVDEAEVIEWAEAKNNWTDPAEAAKAFEADIVIFIELREFQIQDPSSPGLFEGRANAHIQVTELVAPKDSRGKPMLDRERKPKVIYEADDVALYPITGHIPIEAGVNAAVFRKRFMEVVVNKLSWHFIDHNPGDNIQNTRFD